MAQLARGQQHDDMSACLRMVASPCAQRLGEARTQALSLKHPGRFEAREVRPHRGRASGDGRRLILQGTTGLSLRLVPTLEAGILDYGVQGFVPALSTAILAQDLVNDRSRFAFCWRTYCWASTIPSFLISVAGWNVRALPVTKDPVTPYLSVKHVKLQRSKVHTAPRLLVRVHGFAFALLQAGEPSALDGN